MSVVRHCCLAAFSGLALAGVPIVYARIIGQQIDPTDHPVSYLVWVGGSFMAALAWSYARPQRRWLAGAAVFFGFFAAFVLAVAIDIYTGRPQTLWPLGLMFVILIGAPPAFAGAYVGAKLKSTA